MFDAKTVKDQCVRWIRDWFEVNGKGCNAVLGISGGKDSSVCAALCVEALGKDRVIGVTMPNGVQPDIEDSFRLINHLDIRRYNVNVGPAYDALMAEVEAQLGGPASKQTQINMAPRLRMTALYAISQSNNGRVVNTCNLSEDWVGYSTRYGDAAGDFSPLGGLTVQEVVAIGKEMGLPLDLVEKTPSDGLTGLTDGKYQIREVTPPNGYVITSTAPVTFTLEKGKVTYENGDLAEGVTYKKAETEPATDNDVFTIPNTRGVVMPATGGSGTALFTAGGAGLLALALLGWVLHARRRWRGEGID